MAFASSAVSIFSVLVLLTAAAPEADRYLPTWDSLDARPIPDWFDKAKIGIFLHWGVFSVPSFRSEWFWNYWREERYEDVVTFMQKNYPPDYAYQDFAKDFTAEFYDPQQWAQLFLDSGAKYVVLTTKHHEGFTLWPSKTSFSWNAQDSGPHRDLVGDLAQAVRNTSALRFGVYHSLFEWYNPLWLQDEKGNFTTRRYAEEKAIPELYELVNTYQPDIIWSDGEAEALDSYWGSKEFLTWLYNESPVRESVVVNDRWGAGTSCLHGGFYNCADRYSPGVLQSHKWENALTIDRQSWGYRRNAPVSDYLSIEEIIQELVKTVSCGGNVLINIGPTKEGTIAPIYEERLRQLGTWLSLNGEAVYESTPWHAQNDTLNGNVWYTQKGGNVYGIVLEWPHLRALAVEVPRLGPESTVQLLTFEGDLEFATVENITIIGFPDKALVKSSWAYVVRFNNLLV